MGTFSFSVSRGMRHNGGPQTALSSSVRTSGAHTTSTTASNVEDASGDIALAVGEILTGHADEAMRVNFGGTAATATTGHYVAAGSTIDVECTDAGFVSVRDVA